MENFCYEEFKNINIKDPFFDSLKNDYKEFNKWFEKKSNNNEKAYTQKYNGNIVGFLYLKVEKGPIADIEPVLEIDKAVKIGTLKIDSHGTRLGERFIKKSLDYALSMQINILYVTIFKKHEALLNLLTTYGFYLYGEKETVNGVECVLIKDLKQEYTDIYKNYPLVNLNNNKNYLLSVYPKFHTRLFPDSKLKTEPFDVVKDISHTNSIKKVYICRMNDVKKLKKGDILLIYRTKEDGKSANYSSVATSICIAESVEKIKTFASFNDLKELCKNYSVFSDKELQDMYYSNEIYYIIKMIYNTALTKRIIRKSLINDIGLDANKYWGFYELSNEQLKEIIKLGEVNESYIIY